MDCITKRFKNTGDTSGVLHVEIDNGDIEFQFHIRADDEFSVKIPDGKEVRLRSPGDHELHIKILED